MQPATPQPDPAPAPVARARRRGVPLRRKFLFLFLILFFLLCAFELFARAYWSIQGLPFWTCQRTIQHVYYDRIPAFQPFMRPRGTTDDPKVRILILGASTVNPSVGAVPTLLMERLSVALKRRVEIINLAVPAHTSLDSYYKYRELADKNFDLVIVYDGINDLRANNCPPEVFRGDYSHLQWYREINAVENGYATRIFAFPITLKLWLIRAGKQLHLIKVIPEDAGQNPEWSKYGDEIKTAESFHHNLDAMVAMARLRGEKIVVMTFAHYLPPGYTLEKFDRGQLDYTAHWFGVEIWGQPANIMKGLDAHNNEIKKIASEYGNDLFFVDQNALIPKEGKYFNDICHLTNDGCIRFVDNLLPVIVPYLQQLPPTKP